MSNPAKKKKIIKIVKTDIRPVRQPIIQNYKLHKLMRIS